MSSAFLQLLNMSITAGWIVLAVLILRLCLKKAPRWITCLLWGLVALRLILPFNIESPFSLIPSAETVVSTDFGDTSSPVVNSGIGSIDKPLNDWLHTPLKPQPKPIVQPPAPPVEGDNTVSNPTTPNQPLGDTDPNPEHRPPIEDEIVAPEQESDKSEVKSVSRAERVLQIAAPMWLVGIALMLIYELMSILSVHHRVLDAVRLRDNVWQSDRVASPFIFGLFRPRIYVPYGLEEAVLEQVVSHERAHMRRYDHWIKPFAFTLLAVYWYNPLLWVAYILLCRDIEVACDQRAIKGLDEDGRRQYAFALLACGVERHSIAACPLAFGEVGIKHRIKFVLNYRKPLLFVIVVSLLVFMLASICLLTVPISKAEEVWEPDWPVESDKVTTTTTAPNTNTTSTGGSDQTTAQTATGQTKPSTLTGPEHKHAFGFWQVVLSPECTANGSKHRMCSCGYVETVSIPAVGHTYVQNVCVTCGISKEIPFVSDYTGEPNRIGAESGFSLLAAQGDWVYFIMDRDIMKMRTDGTEVSKVWTNPTGGSLLNINVVGDWIYFSMMEVGLDDSYIARVRTDGKGFSYIVTSVLVDDLLIVDDMLYFTVDTSITPIDGVTDKFPLYRVPISNGITRGGGNSIQKISGGWVDCLTSDGDCLYFRYIAPSGEESLRRIDLSTMSATTLMDSFSSIELFVEDGRLYFLTFDIWYKEARLQSISVNGGAVTDHGITSGIGHLLNVCGSRVYYRDWFGTNDIVEYNTATFQSKIIGKPGGVGQTFVGHSGVVITWSRDAKTQRVMANIYDPDTSTWSSVYVT